MQNNNSNKNCLTAAAVAATSSGNGGNHYYQVNLPLSTPFHYNRHGTTTVPTTTATAKKGIAHISLSIERWLTGWLAGWLLVCLAYTHAHNFKLKQWCDRIERTQCRTASHCYTSERSKETNRNGRLLLVRIYMLCHCFHSSSFVYSGHTEHTHTAQHCTV